jgi:hypothetical protein
MEYNHISLDGVINRLAPKPEPMNYKVPVPACVREIFQVGYSINMHVVSGRENSLWHCLLFCLNDNYPDAAWSTRCQLVREAHNRVSLKAHSDVGKVAQALGVNLILIDKLPYEAVHIYDSGKPDFVVFQRDYDWFSVMVANDALTYEAENPVVKELCKIGKRVVQANKPHTDLMKYKAAELRELAERLQPDLPKRLTKAQLCEIILARTSL